MARYTGASCKLCRRQGEKLFLKGTKCQTDKCAVGKRGFPPGQHGKRRMKISDYGLQVGEKQKVRRIYGVLERQFRHYFKLASRSKGVTGEVLLQLLERRLDNVVFKLNFSASRCDARQMVKHGLVTVNGRNVNIPSFMVTAGDVIAVRTKDRIRKKVKDTMESLGDKPIPAWLKKEKNSFEAHVVSLPARSDVGFSVNESLIVELYSK